MEDISEVKTYIHINYLPDQLKQVNTEAREAFETQRGRISQQYYLVCDQIQFLYAILVYGLSKSKVQTQKSISQRGRQILQKMSLNWDNKQLLTRAVKKIYEKKNKNILKNNHQQIQQVSKLYQIQVMHQMLVQEVKKLAINIKVKVNDKKYNFSTDRQNENNWIFLTFCSETYVLAMYSKGQQEGKGGMQYDDDDDEEQGEDDQEDNEDNEQGNDQGNDQGNNQGNDQDNDEADDEVDNNNQEQGQQHQDNEENNDNQHVNNEQKRPHDQDGQVHQQEDKVKKKGSKIYQTINILSKFQLACLIILVVALAIS